MIPQRKGKHTIEFVDTILAIFLVGMNNYFRITIGLENVTLLEQVLFQLGKIVNLSVIRNPEHFIFITHRLLTIMNIDDGQSTMSQADA
ncbi:hypothetical protein D3C78_1700860 [compost metagenome]